MLHSTLLQTTRESRSSQADQFSPEAPQSALKATHHLRDMHKSCVQRLLSRPRVK